MLAAGLLLAVVAALVIFSIFQWNAIYELREELAQVNLMPGPQGPPGPTGLPGLPGPPCKCARRRKPTPKVLKKGVPK